MTGRPPKPTRVKILNGNPGKRPLKAAEPQPARGIPPCPEWLDDYACEKWGEVAERLHSLGVLSLADGETLAVLCNAWSELRHANDLLAAEGRTQESTRGGSKPHPAVGMQRSAWRTIREYSSLFGLDPSSRSRLSVPPADFELDAIDEFLAGS
jgi:P27 family predicted phage terminase small subunit